jgi:uncharacterized membrane protein
MQRERNRRKKEKQAFIIVSLRVAKAAPFAINCKHEKCKSIFSFSLAIVFFENTLGASSAVRSFSTAKSFFILHYAK